MALAIGPGHPLRRIVDIPAQPGFAIRVRPDLPAGPALPLRVGAASLALFGVADPAPAGHVPRYDSMVLWLDGPTVVSQPGIVVLRSGEAVEDTLDHTDPGRDHYRREEGRTVIGSDGRRRQECGRLFIPSPSRHLAGRYLSLLLGNADNHYHWVVLNLARLALLDGTELAGLDGVLIPAGLAPRQREWLGFTGLRGFVEVGPGDAVTVERLLLPWNVASVYGASVRAMAYLRGWAGPGGGAGARVYVDRRAAPSRPLLNEAEVIEALRPHGYAPQALERMTAAEQIALFRRAETIVGPHGAGLANIAFAAPGTRIVELMPSAAVNWCYRHMAAACRHRYDCVLGRNHVAATPEARGAWTVAPTHVLSAIGM